MRKFYVAPVMETEMFETSDIITVSLVFKPGEYKTPDNTDAGIPTVDAGAAQYE